MNILVTGGAGFIGSNLVQYLLQDAGRDFALVVNRVVNLDALTYAGNPANLDVVKADDRHRFVHGDILDSGLVSDLLKSHDIDAVMHLAAESHVDRSIESPEPFIQTNVTGTLRLLEACRHHWRRRPTPGSAGLNEEGRAGGAGGRAAFLHVSTDEVYGSLRPEDPAFNEETPYSPNSPYSASKAASDHLARSYHHTFGLPVITTNCSNNYGPFQFPEKLIPLMIRKAMRGEPLPVYGDGCQVRDWLYVRDHCRALVTALLKGRVGETYVIGGKCEMRNIDVVTSVIAAVQELAPHLATRSPEEMITFVKDRPGHDHRYAINTAKIEGELGWSPQESFASGLRKTVEWYLSRPEWITNIENGVYRGERLGALS